jgi:hypothetical protein
MASAILDGGPVAHSNDEDDAVGDGPPAFLMDKELRDESDSAYAYDSFEEYNSTSMSDRTNRTPFRRQQNTTSLPPRHSRGNTNTPLQGDPGRSVNNIGQADEGDLDASEYGTSDFESDSQYLGNTTGTEGEGQFSYFPQVRGSPGFKPGPNSPAKYSEARRAMRSAPTSDQIESSDAEASNAYGNTQPGRTPGARNVDGTPAAVGDAVASVASPFALEFERAKTKVLSREVKKLRKAIIHGGGAEDHGFSRGSNAFSGGMMGSMYSSDGNEQFSSPVRFTSAIQNSPNNVKNPVQLTPEQDARNRLIVEARAQLISHKRKIGNKMVSSSQRLYNWHDPAWIDKKTDIEAAMLIEKYAKARANVGSSMNAKGFEHDYGLGDGTKNYAYDKRGKRGGGGPRKRKRDTELRKILKREQGWNNSYSLPGAASRTLIPTYDATQDTHCSYTRTKAFKASPYMRMVKNSTFPKHLKAPLTKRSHAEAALRSQAHAASLQASAARAAAAEVEAEYIDVYGNFNDESMEVQVGKFEVELYRTIIIREGLVSRAATLAAKLMGGEKRALGSFNPQLLSDGPNDKNKHIGLGKLLAAAENDEEFKEPGLLEVLDQLRMATVNTIEAVVRWQTVSAEQRKLDRQSRPGTAQTDASGNIVQSGLDFEDMPTFIWNGRNYVTKVATDIDFLDGVPTLQRALGFRLTRNPFVLPGGLDQMPMAAPEIPVVVPTLSSLPAHIVAAASGGKALDSIRLYHAADAVRKEEKRSGSVLRHGLRESEGGLLPDWNSQNLAEAAIAWPSPPRVGNQGGRGDASLGQAPQLQDASAVNLLDAEKRLKYGLGIDLQGRPLNGQYQGGGQQVGAGPQRKGDGAPYLAPQPQNDRWATANGKNRPGMNQAVILHPSDYAAVKQKTGISRTDISSMIAYTVPPAGVKLALQALRILLYPHCDRKQFRPRDKQNRVPSHSDLEWPILRRMAADRDHLLRCMLQFREAVPMIPAKEAALMKYLSSPLFQEDLLLRQSVGAAAICTWIKRVFESASRAKEHVGDIDEAVWGGVGEGDDIADVEEEGERVPNAVLQRRRRVRVARPRSQGTAAGMAALKDELVKLRESLKQSGVLPGSPAVSPEKNVLTTETVKSFVQDASQPRVPPRQQRQRRGVVEGLTLLRIGYRIRNVRAPPQPTANAAPEPVPDESGDRATKVGDEEDAKAEGEAADGEKNDNIVEPVRPKKKDATKKTVTPEDLGTTYAVLTFILRRTDGWLTVEAYEPGGNGSAQSQIHPTYCTKMLEMSLQDIAALPAEGREQRLSPLLGMLRATHLPDPNNNQGNGATVLQIHFDFPRDVFKGACRIRKKKLNAGSTNEMMCLRVEIVDGSGTPHRRRMKHEDGGLMIISWHNNIRRHHLLLLNRSELALLFAQKEHLLRVGDVRTHEELTRAVIDRLWFDGSANDGHLGIDRGVPLALQDSNRITVPYVPVDSETGNKMASVMLSGSVEKGGKALNLKVESKEEGIFNIRLLVSEMTALSGVEAAKTMRLLPAMGRVIDRLFFDTVSKIFKIDKTILHTESKVSGLKLSLTAEIQDDSILFKAMPLTIDKSNKSYRTLTKVITTEDANRLLELDGMEERELENILKHEERAALAERISLLLRLVPLDNDESSLYTGSTADLMKATGSGIDLRNVRLETVLFRRMVHILVSLESLPGESKEGEPDGKENEDGAPLPVGSIRIDDSLTLAQARLEIDKQLGGHVTLPDSFKFMNRDGRPFSKTEEARRTVAESLPSLQLRPSRRRGVRQRVPHRLRAMGITGENLSGISEEDDEYFSDEGDYGDYASASVLRRGSRRGGRRRYDDDDDDDDYFRRDDGPARRGRGRRRGGASGSGRTSGTGFSSSKSSRKRSKGKRKSKIALRSERKRRERLTGKKKGKKGKKAKKVKKKKGKKGRSGSISGGITEGEEGNATESSSAVSDGTSTDATSDATDASSSSSKKKKKGKKKGKKKKGKKKKTPGFMRMNASGAAKKKAEERDRKAKLKEKEELAKKAADKKKRRAARPKTPPEPDMQRLPGSIAVEGGSKVIKTTEVLAGALVQRFNRIRIGKAKANGDEGNLYWISKDEGDAFNETEITLRRPYNDWTNPNCRIYLVLGERGEEKEEEVVVEKEELREEEAKRFQRFFGYKIYWRDVIPMLGEEPKDLHQTKEMWYENVPSLFAAKKTFEYLINLKPASKELDGSKFSKWVKQLPNVIDGKKIKQTDVDLIFAKSKPASERKLTLDNFMNNAIAKVAELRYPWLESTGEGLESPCSREFMKKHVFLWNECAELVWMVRILYIQMSPFFPNDVELVIYQFHFVVSLSYCCVFLIIFPRAFVSLSFEKYVSVLFSFIHNLRSFMLTVSFFTIIGGAPFGNCPRSQDRPCRSSNSGGVANAHRVQSVLEN